MYDGRDMNLLVRPRINSIRHTLKSCCSHFFVFALPSKTAVNETPFVGQIISETPPFN